MGEKPLDEFTLASDKLEQPPASSASPRRTSGYSGWLIGMVFGVLFGLWMLPPVRYTLGSQLRFALAQDSLPWLRSFEAQHNINDTARLDAAASLLPDDYLLQVGRATAFVEADNSSPVPLTTAIVSRSKQDLSDHTLVRLTRVAHDFPIIPGAEAHLARYMMIDRIRIQRAELAFYSHKARSTAGSATDSNRGKVPPATSDHTGKELVRTIPARYSDVKLMTWVLRNGQRIDPENAFWPAMMATTYFAAGRDQQALEALTQCSSKTHWDSYLYEEVLGQWRLYSLSYGDHGAAQKIGPLSLLAFPHLYELRRMAEMARWHADLAAERGDVNTAVQIRRSIRVLGHILRETATWAYEALYGTDLLLISASDCDSLSQQSAIVTVRDWVPQAQHYLQLLQKAGKLSEITVLYTEVEESCRLRTRVDVARADVSYPGIPPGIPLIALFGYWMAGVCLLQQSLLLCLLLGSMMVWQWQRPYFAKLPGAVRLFTFCLLFGLTCAIGILLFTTLPSSRLAIGFIAGSSALLIIFSNSVQQYFRHKKNARSSGIGVPEPAINFHTRWRAGTSWRFLIGLMVPMTLMIWTMQPLLSSLHPMALILTSMMGIEAPTTSFHALQVALLACALPFLMLGELCLWALYRRVAIETTLSLGLRRLFLPTLTSLFLLYLVLLNQTLRLDAEATHAINEAAKDDLHWVLTHSEGNH